MLYIIISCDLQEGNIIATGSADFSIRIWNLNENCCSSVLTGHTGPIWTMILFNKIFLITGSEDCVLKIWDWEYAECTRTLVHHTFSIWGLGLSFKVQEEKSNAPPEPLIASASWDKSIECWHLKKIYVKRLG